MATGSLGGAEPFSPVVSEEAFATTVPDAHGEAQQGQNRGLDAGLARSCPDSAGLSQVSYRSFRRRIDVFERCCRRRGTTAVSEGALLLLQSFSKEPWDACEDIDLVKLDGDDAFRYIRETLGWPYQYDETVEIPQRCE